MYTAIHNIIVLYILILYIVSKAVNLYICREVEADDLIIDGFEITDVKRGKRINKGCVIWSLIAACTCE